MRDWSDEIGWDHSPPGPELPADVVEQTRGKYVEAYERITGLGFEPRTSSVPGDRSARIEAMKARVLIRPKEGILDPQGKAVERALPALGFEDVAHVRVGRMVELEAADADEVAALTEKLLAHPLIEDFEIEVLDGNSAG